jgi:auxin efflux carrier family protein
MPSIGSLIYSGTIPLIKMFVSATSSLPHTHVQPSYVATCFGFILAKKGLFPPSASGGASQVSMNLSLPCLIFANIVPAFTPSNISAIGPLMLLAYTYQAIGLIFGIILREFMYVPRNFWQGILILCGMSNWANLCEFAPYSE